MRHGLARKVESAEQSSPVSATQNRVKKWSGTGLQATIDLVEYAAQGRLAAGIV